MGEQRNVFLGPGQGKKITALGNYVVSKVTGDDTDGALWVMEYTVGPGFAGPPLHLHRTMREIFCVLEGTITFRIGNDTVEAPPGTFVAVAAGTPHAFSNHRTEPAKYLGVVSPGGFERYFDELPALVAEHGYPPPPDVMKRLAEKYDIELVRPV